jgi:hypothetical protein
VTVSTKTTRFTWHATALDGGVIITRVDDHGHTAILGVPYQRSEGLDLFVPTPAACEAMGLPEDVIVDLNVALADGRARATA